LNLPNVFEGYANININLFGDINKPKGSISIASKSGSILKVPYDNLEIKISFSDNFAQIKKATFFKRNEFSVSVIGSLPFWLGKTIPIKSQHEPINIFYEIEDYGLNILKYVTQGYIKPYFGKMSLMGSCVGTYGRIKHNGKILITKGSFDLKDYIGRVKNMFIDLSIAENLVEINKFNFKSGSGKLNVFGSLSLDNFNIKNFNLRFLTDRKGIFIRISQLPKPSILRYKSLRLLKNYSSGKPYFDIRLQGTPDNPKISGYVLLENTRFTFPWNISKTNPFFFIPKNTEFDLEIKTAKNTRFENSFVSALIKGSVHLGGYFNNLKTSGTLVASKGRVDYLGYEFYITSALIEIIDVGQIYISAKGETTIPLTNTYGFENLRFIIERSKISDLSMLKFSSNKNLMDFTAFSKKNLFENDTKVELNKKELIDLKFKGMPSFIICQQTSYFINRIFIAIAKTILTKTGILDDLRVSNINTNVDVSNRGGYKLENWLSGTKYSFEKNLTNQLLFGYSIILDKSRKHNDKFDLKLYHAIELEYKLTDNLFLSASYEFMSDKPDYKLGRKIMFKNQIRF
ncbi:MAG: hypothetical protein LBS78_02075, partial [Endomicrobium sp.]|nr:hypothetical protein [Endomicrobium sp.]